MLQDSWEDSDNEAPPKPSESTKGPAPTVRQKGITRAKIAEKEAAEAARLKQLEEEEDEDPAEKKRRERQMQMQQDLENARSLFGDATIAAAAAAAAGSTNGSSLLNGGDTSNNALAAFPNPKAKEDFDALSETLAKQMISLYGNKPLYPYFMENFVRAVCMPLENLDVKKCASTLTTLANEKQRLAKEATGKKGGKGKAKPSLGVVGGSGGAKTGVTGRG